MAGVQTLGQLVTVRLELAVVDIEVRDPAPLGCTYTAQHVAKGAIEAGIDLASIDEDSIKRGELGSPEELKVPSPALSSCRIEYFRQYDRRGGGTPSCFGNNWDAMSDIGRHLAMEQFVELAVGSVTKEHENETQVDNVLERAKRQARIVLRSFISDLTRSQVEIEFEAAPKEPIIPPSCQIDPPDHWAPHDQNKVDWKRTD